MAKRRHVNYSRAPLPLGTCSLRIYASGSKHWQIKVKSDGPPHLRWKHYATWWWEQVRGPIPAGMRVTHKDGDTLNDDPANLILATPGDVIYIAHSTHPEMSRKGYETVSKVTAEMNRQRAVLRRARGYVSSMWYAVDIKRRIVYNVAYRRKYKVYRAWGVVPRHNTVGNFGAAILGWPDLPFTSACILTCLFPGSTTWDKLHVQFAELRKQLGWTSVIRARLYLYSTELRRLGLIGKISHGRFPATIFITDKGRKLRQKPCPIVAVQGSELDRSFTKCDKGVDRW